MTLLKCLRDLPHSETGLNGMRLTVYGFRSSLTDWAAHRTEFTKEIAYQEKARKPLDAI